MSQSGELILYSEQVARSPAELLMDITQHMGLGSYDHARLAKHGDKSFRQLQNDLDPLDGYEYLQDGMDLQAIAELTPIDGALVIDFGICDVMTEMRHAVSAIDGSIRGPYLPSSMILRVGYHDICDSTSYNDVRLIA